MICVNQDTLAVLAMTNRFTDTGAQPLKASEAWRVLERVGDPSSLLGADRATVAERTAGADVDPERLIRLLDAGVGLAVRLDGLYERGITPVTAVDEAYPSRLRDRLGPAAPPVLYCAGELSLLGADGIGIVGSREVDDEVADVARKVANEVAHAGLPVISGGARGIDSISMASAYETGGAAVGVLADSLEKAIGQAANRRAMLDGRACLCTPYRPDARFSAGSAMGRNKIVYGLSRVTVVVTSAKNEGGTWSGATEALKKGYGRVAVWMGAGRGPGNDALVRAGGIPITQPESVLDAHEADWSPADERQMALSLDGPSAQDAEGEEPKPESEPVEPAPGQRLGW